MKYLIVVPDGSADNPIAELGGKTPLEAAKLPTMDMLASKGEIGTVRTVPEGISPGSDSANLSVMGYDPRRYLTCSTRIFRSGRISLRLTRQEKQITKTISFAITRQAILRRKNAKNC